MATSTLLQLLDSTYGDGTTAIGVTASNRRQEETFLCAEAIVAGDAVSLDMNQTGDGNKALHVVKGTTGGTGKAKCLIGVALETVADVGAPIRVCVRGFCTAKVHSSTAIGDPLVVSGVSGELLLNAGAGIYAVAAVAATAHSGGTATVYVLNNF